MRSHLPEEEAESLVLNSFRKAVVEFGGSFTVGAGDSLDDVELAGLEVDSIVLSYMYTHLERECGVSLETDDLDPERYRTVEDLVKTVAGELRRQANVSGS
ncbi:phosphopantetheine-binding protein [Streptomyces sp. NPDC060022]|uniref:phosphopantetheine-binding protein n=1 Tax=Streptomyces sp. NPDC060022 TaxID=3347039 RepID=UPI00367E97D9